MEQAGLLGDDASENSFDGGSTKKRGLLSRGVKGSSKAIKGAGKKMFSMFKRGLKRGKKKKDTDEVVEEDEAEDQLDNDEEQEHDTPIGMHADEEVK